jgi:DNA-binding transcriptional LysR family regulator
LHIAQPPLSRQIRQLEDERGVDLFVRDRHRVQLTRAGQVSLEEGRKLVVQAGRATEAARHAQKAESGIIRIGVASGLGGTVAKALARSLHAFSQCQPRVQGRLLEHAE